MCVRERGRCLKAGEGGGHIITHWEDKFSALTLINKDLFLNDIVMQEMYKYELIY